MVLVLAVIVLGQNPPLKPLSPASLKATVTKLASWHTRNTNTPELDEVAAWIADRYREIPGMKVEIMRYPVFRGPRVPVDKEVVEVIATLPPNRPAADGVVMMGGHMDTINMEANPPDPYKNRAPGANDDGSGVAGTLDVARSIANEPRTHQVTFVAFSGEEQGLFGSGALAARAVDERWKIDAVLSNDMIGNSTNLAGQSDRHHVRVFSEDSPKHQSRELARWIEWLNRTKGSRGFGVKLVFRSDRFGRGGDHTPFNLYGFNAVRFVEMHEEYSRQHTERDLPDAMDFDYLASIAKVNLLAIKSLANAGPAPTSVRVDRHQNHDVKLTWKGSPDTHYIIYWRDTTEPTWTHFKAVGSVDTIEFKMTSKDENVFAVGAVGGIPVEAK